MRAGLTRRGLALPAVFLAAGFGPQSAAAIPATLVETTAQAAMQFAAGEGVASAAAVGLAKATLWAMLTTKLTLAASLMTVVVAVGTAWGVYRLSNAPAAPQAKLSAMQVDQAWDNSIEQRVTNLKALGVALHDYHDAHGRFPPQAIVGRDGQPLLSWRVAILPFLAERELYARFKLDEAWDSPHNKALIPMMPRIYAAVGMGRSAEGSTYYQAIAGPGAVFDGAQGVASSDIRDGMSETVAVVETGEPVLWTKPEDFRYASDKPLPRPGGLSSDGFLALFFNGEVRFVKKGFDEAKLRGVLTRNGRESVRAADVGELAR